MKLLLEHIENIFHLVFRLVDFREFRSFEGFVVLHFI